MTAVVERARPEDCEEVLRLVEENHLTVEGLRDHFPTTLVLREHGRIVGCAVLELYPEGALLRSVAVAPDCQGRGVGHAVTSAAIRVAEEIGVPAVYLLTLTAERYFLRFGFQQIARTDVPPTVRTSIEFTSACPRTAIVMWTPLRA